MNPGLPGVLRSRRGRSRTLPSPSPRRLRPRTHRTVCLRDTDAGQTGPGRQAAAAFPVPPAGLRPDHLPSPSLELR